MPSKWRQTASRPRWNSLGKMEWKYSTWRTAKTACSGGRKPTFWIPTVTNWKSITTPGWASRWNDSRTGVDGVMESWSHGPQPSITPILHYSSLSEPPFFLQLFDNAFVHQVLGSEAPNLFVASAQEANDVANAVDAGIDLSLINAQNVLITFLGVFDPREMESFGQAFHDLGFILGSADGSDAVEQSSKKIFQ